MARPLRLEIPGGFYHVMARGNERRTIFGDAEDYRRFIRAMGMACRRFGLLVHAYALMPNHYHLLVETPRGRLSRGMHHINGVYSQYFNDRHERVGHLFQGRFKALLVEAESYLLELSRYIHLNPVKARLSRWPWKYPWSSCPAFLGLRDRPTWLILEPTLARFDDDIRAQRREYIRFLLAAGADDPLQHAVGQLILGSDSYVARVKGLAAPVLSTEPEFPYSKALRDAPSPDLVLNAARQLEMDRRIAAPHGSRAEAEARALQIHLLREVSLLSLKEIGRRYGISASAVCKLERCTRERLRTDRGLRDRLESLREGIVLQAAGVNA